ncbi:M13 family metallopeptidase [Ferrimonas lipolytica]|uniref:Peptidase M13 n=1 Tax=Ferrimonas lipolytica TaxID=2724191 RepID=A0A6H1UAM3_9GAMM|nr:M13-type metalloendopeptidase [Ferrimonas lipolytica]QIZ76115.1 peptidase M13 [Ferrimonas lipolytica]
MKKIVLTGLCASAIALAGCSQMTASTAETSATAQAVQQALSSGIDQSTFDYAVRPQDDFYNYVNGTWLKNNEVPADRTSTGVFYDLRDKADKDVKNIINELAGKTDLVEGSDEQKVAALYNSVMDTDTINALGLKPIQAELDNIAGINDFSELAAYFGHAAKIGINSPFVPYVSIDAKNSTTYAAHIWQSGLSLPDRDYYFKDDERSSKLRADYQAHIENMFALANLPNPSEAAVQILAIETALAEHHNTNVENRDSEKRYNKFATAELSELNGKFDWTAYMAAVGVADVDYVIINQPNYIKALAAVMESFSVEEWKTYQTWHALNAYSPLLSSDIEAEHFDFFSRKLQGQQEMKPRWKTAVDIVNSDLGEVVGKVYVKRHFTPEAKARMTVLVENLRTAYGQSIDELTWMGDETKQKAKAKLAAFTPKIGYPDKWEDYSKLEVKADDLVGNRMRSGILVHEREVAKIGGPIHTWEWHMTPQTVNAYYNPPSNEIVFPAAILQPPFFNMDADDAVNYGGIGAVIGHEMGHGFDDQGSRYDGDGNLNNWWTDEDLAAFKGLGNALIAQYDAFEVFDDLNVNGKLTLGENIGDLSGVTIGYKAYHYSLEDKPAPVIDGMTGDQRFFIGFTQIWRAKYKEESLRNRVATDPHSPAHFRANGPLANVDEFYQAFDVSKGDKMYIEPAERVKIW